MDLIALPLAHERTYSAAGIWPAHCVLLHGLPGCGKSHLVRQVARFSGLPVFTLQGPEVFRKFQGDSEAMVEEVFRKATGAGSSPSLIFMTL